MRTRRPTRYSGNVTSSQLRVAPRQLLQSIWCVECWTRVSDLSPLGCASSVLGLYYFIGTTLPRPRPSFHQLRRILCWTLWVRVMALTFNAVLQPEYVSLTELHVSTTCEVHVSCNYRLWQYTVHWSTFDIIVVIFLFECVLAWKNWHIFRNVLSSTAFESNLWFTKKLDPITLVPSHQILTRAVTRSRALL